MKIKKFLKKGHLATTTTTMEISFNRNVEFTKQEKRFICKVLLEQFQDKLSPYEKICVLRNIHHSRDDVLPHFTFRIWNDLIDTRDVPFIRMRDYHGYVWAEQDGSFTLDFITQYTNEKKIAVF